MPPERVAASRDAVRILAFASILSASTPLPIPHCAGPAMRSKPRPAHLRGSAATHASAALFFHHAPARPLETYGRRRSSALPGAELLIAEPHAPIDRTKLSKALIADAGAVEWREPVHIERALKATLRSGTQVRGVDLEQRAVLLDGGESVLYETLVLGTGGSEWCMRIAVEWR